MNCKVVTEVISELEEFWVPFSFELPVSMNIFLIPKVTSAKLGEAGELSGQTSHQMTDYVEIPTS